MSIALGPSRSLLGARTLRRATVVGAGTAAAVLLLAGPALAHITVTPDTAAAGSAAVLTFHVPNEEATASTVKVDVQIPTAHPIAQLLVKPVPGWTSSVKTITLAKPVTTDDGTFNSAVSEVIWSGGQIRPGQFQDFTISADPLPEGISQLVFKAIQTYSNADIVRWIDLSQPGQPEPDHPAATLTLTTAKAPAGTATTTSTAASAGSGTDGMARVLGVAGLVFGVLASLLALTVARRDRRRLAGIGAGPDTTPASAAHDPGNGQPGDRALAGPKAAARRDQVLASAKTSAKRRQSRRSG